MALDLLEESDGSVPGLYFGAGEPEQGEREFCGIQLPDGLTANQKLPDLMITPSTKGILKNIPGLPEADDVNITRQNIIDNYSAFNFNSVADIDQYEKYLTQGFNLISEKLAALDQIFVDTKFEFGYVSDENGNDQLIYMDEVGTPDSSRIWDGAEFRKGHIIENSKEGFRQSLLNYFPDPDILLNKNRMEERSQLAKNNALPLEFMMDLSKTYLSIVEKIIGKPVELAENPKQEILDVLSSEYQLIQ